jgi:uncharacterized circularly permuted ATP-grasp superfamily protein/uncharacterized alpha-E superfamily protein
MPAAPGLFTGYTPGHTDELVGPDGKPRAHWEQVLRGLEALGGPELERLETVATRMIRDNGVTYNVYGDPNGPLRPWDIDIVPLAISAAEWRALEAGLIQRAELLNRILADLYSGQTLFRSGALPAPLAYASPQFLRPFHGMSPPGGVWLHLYAADLGRRADGSWEVLADRTEAPSGMGYALENRIIVSQILPELFRDCRVERIAAFFAGFREKLFQLSGEARPHAVLLTPGPLNEAYFEHAYLARYLGFTLVEGDDLMVRDRRVYLKTLAGPRKIDIILRRQDSDFCDPLELRTDSALGVPGLADAARAGGCIVVNALGSGVAETRALMPYLPRLARDLLGEDLKLPSIETYWCGDAGQRIQVQARQARLHVAPVGRQSTLLSKAGPPPANGADPAWAERLARQGVRYWAEAPPRLSTMPVEEHGRVEARPMTLRCFVAMTPEGYRAMPGGLARVTAPGRTGEADHAVAKDVWVRIEGNVSTVSLLRPRDMKVDIRRTADDLPSRAADNLFWLGRYAERAEDLTRTLRALLTRLGETSGMAGHAGAAEAARRLLVPMGQISSVAAELAAAGNVAPLIAELCSLLYDPGNTNGLKVQLSAVTRAAWRVRDRLSADAWRALNALSLPQVGGDPEMQAAIAKGALDDLIRTMAAFAGLATENMTRGPNFLFLDIGRRLERATNTVFLLRAMLSENQESANPADTLSLLLEIADSTMTYRSRYLGQIETAPVIDLVLLDETNPRSGAFQIAMLKSLIGQLPRATSAQAGRRDKEIVESLHARLRTIEARTLDDLDKASGRPALGKLLTFIEDSLPQISDELTEAFFRLGSRRRAGAAPRQRPPAP